MVVYSFYLFTRSSHCICYREWRRNKYTRDAPGDQKNMFGMLFALRNFCSTLTPKAPPPRVLTPGVGLATSPTPPAGAAAGAAAGGDGEGATKVAAP
eukprot:CAMPEP_0174895906 /NCGR_PEP_ID=MMETSP0167-20121228/10208_1 /TAXON_ID=38298 /ORGANISM="Rhodella maculata, Strain CCMP736" /LENGTH=96 /DNA_ID=CAMNT_0016135333 /DNA_START=177 /DNA_END=463 /DNA_ORIENTATION=+